MKKFAVLFTTIFALIGMGAGSPTQYVIDFRQSNNLKVVFDSGLRPKRFLGLDDHCEIRNENLKVILAENCNFVMKVENADIQVLAENQIYRIELQGEFQTWAIAAQEIKDICTSLGIDTKDFDEYVGRIDKGDQRTPTPGGLLMKKGGVDIQVGFNQPLLFPNPKSRAWVVLIWPQPDETMKFLTEPIKPPPGYENISMDPPPHNPNQRPIPDPKNAPTSPEDLAKKMQAYVDAQEAATSQPSQDSVSKVSVPTPKAMSKPAESSPISWLLSWRGLLLALILVVGLFVFLRRR